MKTLESHLQHFVLELKDRSKDYKDKKHQDGDIEIEGMFKGKHEAYSFVAKELESIIKWHSEEE